MNICEKTGKNWIDINDESHGVYNTGSQIKFKTSVLRSGLCGYSDIIYYIFHKKYMCLLKGLYQSKHKQEIIEIIEIQKEYLKIALHLLIAYLK